MSLLVFLCQLLLLLARVFSHSVLFIVIACHYVRLDTVDEKAKKVGTVATYRYLERLCQYEYVIPSLEQVVPLVSRPVW